MRFLGYISRVETINGGSQEGNQINIFTLIPCNCNMNLNIAADVVRTQTIQFGRHTIALVSERPIFKSNRRFIDSSLLFFGFFLQKPTVDTNPRRFFFIFSCEKKIL